MFGMIVGTIIANWRNAKITEATFKEFGEHVVNDVWNVTLLRLSPELAEQCHEKHTFF
jgi:hypothetical protein